MNGNILVVGGYGNVGRAIAVELGERFPGRVIAAGRDLKKAEAFARQTDMKVLALELDAFGLRDGQRLPAGVCVVVMCLDDPDAAFAKICLRQGAHYVDISATHEILSRIELLDGEARNSGATAVLSVGLAPGVTNLLAAHCRSKIERIDRADIFVMLGLGEAHGEAAIRWTIENLDSEFDIRDEGRTRRVASFGEGKRTVFPEGIGARTAFRFNFSDQQVLPRTLGIPSVSTWVCFDSALMTHLFALYRKIGLFAMLKFKPVREMLVKLFKAVHFGSDIFVMKVDAHGIASGRMAHHECSVTGYGEGRATAIVTAEVAAALFTASMPPGVFHMEQLFDLDEMIAKLEGRGLSFSTPDSI